MITNNKSVSIDYMEGALNALDIKTRNNNGEWITVGEIFEEIHARWDELSKNQKDTTTKYFNKPVSSTPVYRDATD